MGRGEGDGDDDVYMYGELWKACAGSLIYFPRVGDFVYYFRQGHLEQQVEASTDHESNQPQPYLPSKILCRVINVHLLAEQDTNDVYAQVKLLREADGIEPTSTDSYQDELLGDSIQSFYKVLTASDVGKRHELYVSKSHADKCFPPLDMSAKTPEQLLVAKDIHGKKWKFKHTYKGKSPRHMFTTGWNAFVRSKKLVVGDRFVFLRGDDGELHIGVSRLTCPESSFVSSRTAFHVPLVGHQFSVTYKPRLGQFIIPLNKYDEAFNKKFSVGMRIKMPYGVDDRFSGAILGIGDICHTKWPNSAWRCLKIRWDETPSIGSRPEHVSPWEIQPLAESILQSSIQMGKKVSLGKRKLHVNPNEQENGYQTQPEDTTANHDLIGNNNGQVQPWNIHNMDIQGSFSDIPHSFSSLASNRFTNLNQGNDQNLFDFGGETSTNLQQLSENTGHIPFDVTQVPVALQDISSNMSYVSRHDQDSFEFWGETSNCLQPLPETTAHMPFEGTQVCVALQDISSNMSYISGNDQDLFDFGGETSTCLPPLSENTCHMLLEGPQIPMALQDISSNMAYSSAIPCVNWCHGLVGGDELVSWGIYSVARRSIAVLDKIKTQYPDMLSSFKVKSNRIQSAMLETLAEVVYRVETITIESVNQDQLDEFLEDINDLKVNGIEVDWIEERLQAIFRRNVLVQRHKELSQEIQITSAKCEELKGELHYVDKELEDVTSKISTETLTAQAEQNKQKPGATRPPRPIGQGRNQDFQSGATKGIRGKCPRISFKI